jgi:hypothetical protein
MPLHLFLGFGRKSLFDAHQIERLKNQGTKKNKILR